MSEYEEQSQSAAAQATVINSVSLKLPPFWSDSPKVWFIQAEAQFALRSPPITKQITKFYHVLEKLPQNVARDVLDICENPDPATAYTDLKKRLLASFTPTRWQEADTLLDHPGLGDRRPTALMASMLAHLPAGDSSSSTLFLALFLRRLPSDIRSHLVTTDFKTPREMAEYADKLWDARSTEDTLLATAINKVSVTDRADRSPSPSPRHRRQTPARPNPAPRTLCYYHSRFGQDAQKCENPCSFQGNARAGGRRRN